MQLQAELSEHRSLHEGVVKESNELLQQFTELQSKFSQLVSDLDSRQEQLDTVTQQLADEQQAHQYNKQHWDALQGKLQVCVHDLLRWQLQ